MPSVLAGSRFWLGALISVACLWLAVQPVSFAELEHSLGGANYVWLVAAFGLQIAAVLARAQRWVVLLRSEARLLDALWSLGIGYLFTNVFPLRLGEPTRVVVLAERGKLPITRVAASAIVERLLDVSTILLVLFIVLPFMQIPAFMFSAAKTFSVVVLLGFVGLFVLVRSTSLFERLLRLAQRYCRFVPARQILTLWQEVVRGLELMGEPRIALKAIFWSVATWSLSLTMYWCVLRAFSTEGRLFEAAFLMVLLALASSIPSSPGFIGVFQLVGQQALVAPFGPKYSAAVALGVTSTVHFTYYVLTTALGLVSLVVVGTSLTRLRRIVSVAPSIPTATRDVVL